ncbi:Penicillin acylase precursor [compost metagenome]
MNMLISLRQTATAVLTGVALGAALISPATDACTTLVLPATDHTRIYARTMEFAMDTKSRLVGLPRNLPLTGQKGLVWKAKYAVTGMNAFNMPALLDGMNEKGLAGGALYFPGLAGYTEPGEVREGSGLAPWEFLTWVLTNFATVEEVKAALPTIRIMSVTLKDMGIAPPLHYTLHDATGASIVIEPVSGELKVYDNPVGVMTNSPDFAWHLSNLRNYANLTPENVSGDSADGMAGMPADVGYGLRGMPGDPTSASRFVRAVLLVRSAQKTAGGLPGVRMAEHIASNFDIPKGLIRDKGVPGDYTQWISVADLGQKRYYIRTWDNPVLSGVGFGDFDINGPEMTWFVIPKVTQPQTFKPQREVLRH